MNKTSIKCFAAETYHCHLLISLKLKWTKLALSINCILHSLFMDVECCVKLVKPCFEFFWEKKLSRTNYSLWLTIYAGDYKHNKNNSAFK